MTDRPTLNLSPSTVIPRPSDTPRPIALMKAGDYQLLREVGRGGMGVVYEAYDPRLRRRAAVKMPLVCPHPDVIPRFQTEAEAMAQLAHPNIVGIFDVGTHDGLPFVACEFLPGASLQARTAGKPQPPREAAELVRTLAGAVHHAHQHGVVHRDLKPANILFTADGTPKVTDFGVARLGGDPSSGAALTQVGQVVGTPQYMSPEQALALPEGTAPAVDVYSLGAILYDQLTGRPPHDGPDSIAVLTAVACHDPAPPHRLVPTLPRDLETVCLTALERNPARRYPSAEALADDLGRFLAGEPVKARPAGYVRRLVTKARRRPLEAGLLLALAAVVAAGLAGVGWQWRRAVAARDAAEENAVAARNSQADAEEQARIARRSLSDSTLSLAARHVQTGDLDQAQAELDRTTDRGWEWHHLRRLTRPYLWRAGVPDNLWPQVVAVSPDGTRVAVAAGDPYRDNHWWDRYQPSYLHVADAATGDVLMPPRKVLPRRAEQMVWLDDNRLAVRDHYGATAVVPVGTGDGREWPVHLLFHRGSEPAGQLSPDGRWAVRGSFSGALTRINPGEPAAPTRNDRHARPVLPVAVHPSGLAAVSELLDEERHDLLLIDLSTGRLRGRIPDFGSHAALSADGRRVAACLGRFGRRGLGVYDTTDGSPVWVREVPTDGFDNQLHFTPDGRHLIEFRHESKRARVWDAAAGAVRFDLVGHTSRITAIAPAPDGRTVATGGNDGTVRLWSLADGRQLAVLHGHQTGIRCLAFDPTAARLVSGGMDGTLAAWDLTRGGGDGGELPPLDPADGTDLVMAAFGGGMGVTPDGTGWALNTHRGRLEQFDPVGLTPGRRTELVGLRPRAGQYHTDFALSPDGRRLFGPADPHRPTQWDTATGQPVGPLPAFGNELVLSAGYSPDGQRAAAVLLPGYRPDGTAPPPRALVWDTGSGAEVWAGDGGGAGWQSLTFLPDGRLALGREAADGTAGGLDLLDPATGHRTRHPTPEPTALLALTPSADGRWLAGLSVRSTTVSRSVVYLWEVASGRLVWAKADPGRLCGLAFSPDGERLAAARLDDRVTVWRTDTGGTMLVKTPPSDRLGDSFFPARVAFTPDGRLLANHADTRLSVWATDPATEADRAAARRAEAERGAFTFHLRAAAELAVNPGSVGFRLHLARLNRLRPPTERCKELLAKLKQVERLSVAAAVGGTTTVDRQMP